MGYGPIIYIANNVFKRGHLAPLFLFLPKSLFMHIRPATSADLTGITRLFFATVNKVNSKDYSAEHIQAWAEAALDQEYWQAKVSELYFWVAESADAELLGFISLTPEGYLDHIFVHDQHQHEGIASALLTTLEAKAHELNLQKIDSDVSITAKPFFDQQGYIVEKENRKEWKGLVFINYRMSKVL